MGAAQDLGKGRVGRPALGVALAHQGQAARHLHVRHQLSQQPGLAHPRLAAHQEQLALSPPCPLPQRPRLGQLRLTGDQAAADDAVQHRDLGAGRLGQDGRHLPGGQAAQFAAHRSGRRRAALGVLGQKPDDQRVQPGRDLGVSGPRWNHGGVQVLADNGQGVVGLEGEPAGEQFVKHDPQGIEVGPRVKGPAQGQLRRQVKDAADDRALLRQPRGQRAGQPKVCQLGRRPRACLRLGRQQHVLRLQIAVHDAVAVGVLQRRAHLPGDGQDLVHARGGRLVQRRPLDQLHHKEGGSLGLADVVDGDHVRML